MNRGACGKMVAASWFSGSLIAAMPSAGTFSEPFCGSEEVPQFFCDFSSIIKFSCSKIHIPFDVILAISACLGIFCLVCILVSYVRIFRAVLRMPASEGRAKAFSTCLPHLIVTTVFFTTVAFANLKPQSGSWPALDMVLSVFYVVPDRDSSQSGGS
ncbi:olfactory receptor 14A2-like [Tachyglossus aculeatus]|uniref:olfactory receptor 14A2-like n=1 Tax=Tachyglossus aculeatus TaxID=9261 RepID=UPI0018F6D368|nr:olfactory receptor 14A2-like [Tachyglossus aculeatus]